MKTIALFAALLFSQLAFSQNFISENKLWHVKHESWGSVNTQIFKIEGDTVINSFIYNKLWYSWDSTMTNKYLNGFIREESNIVYYRNYYSSKEGILYDFNLDVGDTTYIKNEFCEDMQVIINDIDTVEYLGISRKRWICEGWSEEYWVEGIGSLYGLVYSFAAQCITDNWFDLLCFHENDTLYYLKLYEDECYQTNVGIKDESDGDLLIFRPNPVIQGQSFVLQYDKGIEEVEIYNSAGVMVKQFTVDHQQSLFISSVQLTGGLYFIRARTTENKVLSEKIIIR